MDPFQEELLAVEAIFPECIYRNSKSDRRLIVRSDDGSNALSISLLFPEEYPEQPPSILAHTGIGPSLTQEELENSWTPGEVCLYVLVDKLRELSSRLDSNVTQSSPHKASPERTGSTRILTSGRETDHDYEFSTSDPIVDRKSTFVGRAIEVHSRAEARAALLWLKQHDKKIAKATHNIVAWRL